MPIPPWCRGAHCERCPCCLGVSVLCVSGSLSHACAFSCRRRTNLGKRSVRWFRPVAVQRHDRDWMPKTVCLVLACLVLAAGQAATRDTTQWRCRNRKLSCKRWAADNQCTANYPFMAEGALHFAGTRHTAHGTRSGARRATRRKPAHRPEPRCRRSTGTPLDRHMHTHCARSWCHACSNAVSQSVRLRATCARTRVWPRRRRRSSSTTSAAASCSRCRRVSRIRRTRLTGAASTAATT